MYELYSPEGLRSDGRRWNELRFCQVKMNTHPKSADGSATVEMGATKVVALVEGPREPESKGEEKMMIQVNISMAPFSGQNRDKRPTNDRRIQEMSLRVEQLLNEVLLVHLSPRTETVIKVTVLAQDGGVLAAIINAASLALVDAGVPMYEYVSACSAALYDQSPLLDPSNLEENDLPCVNLAAVGTDRKVALCVIDRRIALDRIAPSMEAAVEGCVAVRSILDREVRRHGAERLAASASA